MPLYIANTAQWRATAETADLSALILQAPNLQILYHAQTNPPESTLSGAPQSIFELHNSLSTEQPYVLLPNVCPTMLFILHHHRPACYLCGPLTAARKLMLPAGALLMCVYLKPGQLWHVNKRLSSSLANQVIPLYKCFADADILLEHLNQQSSPQGRTGKILQFLEAKLSPGLRTDPVIMNCMESMQKAQGLCRIHEIAVFVSRSERFLSRTFRDIIGLPMKTYCEILKFQNALFGILTLQPRNLSKIVRDYGYYDLPHMNRAFKKFINYTASDVRFICAEEMYALALPLE